MWQHWINFLAGIWLILSAFVSFAGNGMQANLIVSGIAVAVLAIWGAMSTGERMGTMTR